MNPVRKLLELYIAMVGAEREAERVLQSTPLPEHNAEYRAAAEEVFRLKQEIARLRPDVEHFLPTLRQHQFGIVQTMSPFDLILGRLDYDRAEMVLILQSADAAAQKRAVRPRLPLRKWGAAAARTLGGVTEKA